MITLDDAIKNIEHCMPSIAVSDSWLAIKAHLSQPQPVAKGEEDKINGEAVAQITRKGDDFNVSWLIEGGIDAMIEGETLYILGMKCPDYGAVELYTHPSTVSDKPAQGEAVAFRGLRRGVFLNEVSGLSNYPLDPKCASGHANCEWRSEIDSAGTVRRFCDECNGYMPWLTEYAASAFATPTIPTGHRVVPDVVEENHPYSREDYPTNDRDMLLYLMRAFDAETWQCDRCGHSEDTKTMDSAHALRDYLAASPFDGGV